MYDNLHTSINKKCTDKYMDDAHTTLTDIMKCGMLDTSCIQLLQL